MSKGVHRMTSARFQRNRLRAQGHRGARDVRLRNRRPRHIETPREIGLRRCAVGESPQDLAALNSGSFIGRP